MRRLAFLTALVLIVNGQRTSDVQAGQRPEGGPGLSGLPVFFERNEGQASPDVKFLCVGSDARILFKPSEIVWVLSANGSKKPKMLKMRFLGANPAPELRGIEVLPGKTNS